MINESILDIITNDEGRIMTFPNSAYLLGLAFNVKMMEAAELLEKAASDFQVNYLDNLTY